MPQSIQQAERALALFEQTANKTSEKGSIVFKNGALVSRGRVGTTFSRNASRRAAVDALLTSITTKYGAHVADMVGGSLAEIRGKAKPLRAATVRDVLASAAQKSQEYKSNNVARLCMNFQHGAYGQAIDDAITSFAEQCGMNEAQRQEVRDVVQTEIRHRPRLFPGAEERQTCGDIVQKIKDGLLPCMIRMKQMLKPGASPAAPFLFYSPGPGERKDIAWLQAFAPSKNDNALCYLLQRIPEMREMQPDGLLTLHTVWNVCFGENPPEGLHLQSPKLPEALSQRLDNLVAHKLQEHHVEPSEGNKINIMIGMSTGLKLDAAVERAAHPGPITLEDMCRQPTALRFNPARDTEASVEENLAKDIKRLILPSPDSNAFTFTRQDGTVTTIHPMSTEGLGPEDKEQWAAGKPSSRSREIMEAAASLCAPDAHAQKLMVASCFHQSALMLSRCFSPLAGVMLSEHTGYDISARADAGGSVRVDFKTPEDSQALHEMTFVIHTDGSSHITQFNMGANPDYVPRAPAPAMKRDVDVSNAKTPDVDESTVISSSDDYSDVQEYYPEGAAVPGKTVKPESDL